MYVQFLIVLVLFLLSLVCPKGYKMYDNSCYKLFEDGMTMKDGKVCQTLNFVKMTTSITHFKF